MSRYSDPDNSADSYESLPMEEVEDTVLRKRKLWDPDTESITSEIKDLLEEDVNSLVGLTLL